MQVTLTQRFGEHQPGESVEVDDATGRWLIGINRGFAKDQPAPLQGVNAPGTDGADQLAGGDPTRRYGLVTLKTPSRGDRALPVPGSPVQYNAGVADGGRRSGRDRRDYAATAAEAEKAKTAKTEKAEDKPARRPNPARRTE